MQTCRKLHPLLKISRQSFKPKPVSNLVDLEQTRNLRAPRLIPLTVYEENGNAAEFINRGVGSFQNGFSLQERVHNPATMITNREFTLPSFIGDAGEFTTGAKTALECQQENRSENDGTKKQKLLSGMLLSSYLLCLLVYPHIFQ